MRQTGIRWPAIGLFVIVACALWYVTPAWAYGRPVYLQQHRYVFPVQLPDDASFGQYHHDYPATDIAAPEGSSFVAPTDGVIEHLRREDPWDGRVDDPSTRGGRSVSMIGDDGVRYYGSHLSQVEAGLEVGQRVEAGAMLGRVGDSGNARGTAPHLHFGISHPTFPEDWLTRRGEVSPYPYLQAWLRGEGITPQLSVLPCAEASNCRIIGTSVEGRSLEAYRFGAGPINLALIGGIHGGYEWNSTHLMNRLLTYLSDNTEIVPTDISLYIIPTANPDGLAHSGTASGRFNANEVDLNRNWDCDWQPEARWLSQPVNPGTEPFSEPETRSVRNFLMIGRFVGAIFYHSAGTMVTAGSRCGGGDEAKEYSHAIASVTNYVSMQYPQSDITGESTDWLSGKGIPSVTIELTTHTAIDWEMNMKGLQAIFQVALARGPAPVKHYRLWLPMRWK